MNDPVGDPGWGPVIRRLPVLVIPVVGMMRMTRETNGLVAMRILWVVFVNAVALIGVVVIVLGGELDGTIDSSLALGVTGSVGVLAQLVGARFIREADVSSVAAFVPTFQRWFFTRVALAEAAAFLGLVMFILSASRLVYVVGAVIAFAGMVDAAPSARRLAGLQKKADAEGGGLEVLAALQQGGLSH